MMGISNANGGQPYQSLIENSPTNGLLRFLVPRGGIEPPTQGFSTRSARPISLLNHLVLPPCENFVHKINMPFVWD